MKKSVALLILLFSIFSIRSFGQQDYHILQEANFMEPVLTSGALTDSKTFMLNVDELKKLITEEPNYLTFSIPNLDGESFEIGMVKRNITANGFQVKTSSGNVSDIDYGIHYAGKLARDPKSLVAFSFYKDCLFGLIATDAGNYNVVFLRDENKSPSKKYVLYNDRDLTIPNTFHCGTDMLPKVTKPTTTGVPQGAAKSINCRQITQYLECDHRMYTDNGSSVQNTVGWTTGMFNVMSYIYYNEQINLQISEIFVWDTDDPYTDEAGAALTEFGDARQNNFNGDLAHFLTTLPSGNGGLAWLDVLCADYGPDWSYGPYAYSNIDDAYSNLPLWSWTINVVTHETGHNFGSPHTQWCGWEVEPGFYASIDSCYTTEEDGGNSCYQGPNIGRVGTIMSYCHLTGSVNLNLGFGPLPGNLIRERASNAPCITTYTAPDLPTISGQLQYCVTDDVLVTATSAANVSWVGPNGFQTNSSVISIPNAVASNSGMYVASVSSPNCTVQEFVNIQVSARPSKPVIMEQNNGSLKMYPTSSAYTYFWYDVQGNLVFTGQTFLPAQSGEYYAVISRYGCESISSDTATYFSYASIHENTSTPINIWPNPSSDVLYIASDLNISNESNVVIVDMGGRTVFQKNITNQNFPLQININTLAEGMYVLEINNSDTKTRIKFLKKN